MSSPARALWLAVMLCMIVLGVSVSMLLVPRYGEAETIITSALSPGDTTPDVTMLQRFLASESMIYPENIVSGTYGPLTQAAVGRFQCAEGIACSGSASTNGYGRVGPTTLAAINRVARIINGNPMYDIRAPIMTAETVATTSTSATITWTTSEPARSRVMYGTSYPFLYAVAPSITDATVDTTSSVTLSGLMPNTMYHYVRESIDPSENVMWTIHKTFTTMP